MTELIFTAEQLAELKAYRWPRDLWAAVGPLVNLVVLGASCVVFPKWVSPWLTSRARDPQWGKLGAALEKLWGAPGWAAALLFSLAHFAFLWLADLPVDVYFDFWLERAYGLSRQSFGAFVLDTAKASTITAVAAGCLAFGLYGLARRTRRWWLLLGVPSALLMLVSGALDPYRGRLYFEQRPLEEGPLLFDIKALLERAQVEVANVWVEKTSTASVRVQAYFAGQGATRSIVLNDELLEKLERPEILAAVAHEAGHVHESRITRAVGASAALLGFLWLVHGLLSLAARRGWWGSTQFADLRTLPAITLIFYLALLASTPLSAWYSRQRELAADRYALSLTGDSEALRSLLVKAARINRLDPTPPWWVAIRQSHPTVLQRLSAIDASRTETGR